MCGITGWIDWQRDLTREVPVIEAMGETMARRGPDDAGLWISRRAALAHRRLIVVDPEGGAQPMIRERGGYSCVVVYNGELYNTPELRHELAARGYTFRGHSDTEVLLISYLEWGEECVNRLNGIFAFGIWDEREQKLFLARDRLGVKPLFYSIEGSALVFGSELKAILAHPLFPPEIGAEGLAEIFVMGPARTPGLGVFKRIHELRPGCTLSHTPEGTRISTYWKLESHPHPDDLEITTATLRFLLQDTVERQLVADVPVCVLLSGGIDSSSVTSFASRAFSQKGLEPLHTFSVDYSGSLEHYHPNDYETGHDNPFIELMSAYAGTVHRRVLIDNDSLVDSLESAVLARDLPGMTDIDSSLYLFCQEVKKEATVALSGESADEIFGGYPWFYRADSLSCNTFPWIRMLPERTRLLNQELVSLIHPDRYLEKRYREALEEVPRLPGEEEGEAKMRELLYLNITRFMPILLDRKDRMSMYCGLEVRVPFCDHRLAQYAWNIPWSMKTWGGQAKGILRRALAGVLPEEIRTRRKSPYPKTHNPAFLDAMRHRLLEVLHDPGSPLLPLVNARALTEVAEGRNQCFSSTPWFSQLMGLPQLLAYFLQVDIWLRHYRVSISCQPG